MYVHMYVIYIYIYITYTEAALADDGVAVTAAAELYAAVKARKGG